MTNNYNRLTNSLNGLDF